VRVRFLLGPAGSGKTSRCLAEIRDALKASPGGAPLLLLAPKQATFQLERQLLADPGLAGYTRLQILSFERLAGFILAECGQPADLLDEEGRVMVLRALLARLEREQRLRIFHSTARLPGFARQLSLLLRELQRHHLTARRLQELADRPSLRPSLAAKLADVASLLNAYLDWLKTYRLEDSDRLLDLASATLRLGLPMSLPSPGLRPPSPRSAGRGQGEGSVLAGSGAHGAQEVRGGLSGPGNQGPGLAPPSPAGSLSHFRLDGLWLDGFAEMAPQELDLLAALLPCCAQATLAFCLDGEPEAKIPWHSTWSVVAQSYRQCRAKLEALPGCRIEVLALPRDRARSRFAQSDPLAFLEAHWADPPGSTEGGDPKSAIRLAACPHPEAEATLAAHEILRHVRAGGRYRDCAVLVRALEPYHDVLRRVLARYGIPHFVDRREAVAHHPLAELTRCALRTVAYGWRREDWFGVLKSGLLPADEEELDWLENRALQHGWEGEAWRNPIRVPGDAHESLRAEQLRARLTAPFLELEAELGSLHDSQIAHRDHEPPRTSPSPCPLPARRGEGGCRPGEGRYVEGTLARPSGRQLASALSNLWHRLGVEETLAKWCAAGAAEGAGPKSTRSQRAAVHQTVWEQMQGWLDNLERAFAEEAMSLRDWLPITEAGLCGLTVGVVPPALDQVLVGAVDRSRNPDLRLTVVLGVNEGVFPAPPPSGTLLNDVDRTELELQSVFLGLSRKSCLSLEQYLGYIACTRSRERLVLAWSLADADGGELKPSLFCDHLKRLFPGLKEDAFAPFDPAESLRASVGGAARSPSWHEAVHAVELAPALLLNKAAPERSRITLLAELESLPVFQPLLARWQSLQTGGEGIEIQPARLEGMFGRDLKSSVSALEDYAECPFKFLVARGFRAEERERFEIDPSARGEFQHEVLKLFQVELQDQGKRWRSVTADEASSLIRQLGEKFIPGFRGGVFAASAGGRFQAEVLIQQLERLVGILVGWAPQYGFDPQAGELGFGMSEGLPPWVIQLEGGRSLHLRGYIDRVDLHVLPGGQEALAAVIDYKSTVRPLDATKLHHGLQLQLLSYLGVLRRLENPQEVFGVSRLRPTGGFYVGLGGQVKGGRSRAEVLENREQARQLACQHTGRFDEQGLRVFDTRPAATCGDQFKWKTKLDGSLSRQGTEALPSPAFAKLLDENEARLREIGGKIFAGQFPVDPYRKDRQTACDYCDYRAVCRFDPWLQPYRVLRPPSKPVQEAPKPAKVRP
jgi:ATP-dependent helicase/nuclease subunit B